MIYLTDKSYKSFTFSGGEQHVKLLGMPHYHGQDVTILKRIQSATDIMEVLQLNDIVRTRGAENVHLIMPYIPYARQDRATTTNTSRALKVFADLLNSCNFKSVKVLDPHSMVAENLINNMQIIRPVENILLEYMIIHKAIFDGVASDTVLISPDVGALKKVESYAKYLGIKDVMAFHKVRDPATGDIKGIRLVAGEDINLLNRNVVVVDDLADGGRTFTELLASYPDFGLTKSLHLFVTHGIFSKGLQPLFDAGFTHIGTTDSFIGPAHDDPRLDVVQVVY